MILTDRDRNIVTAVADFGLLSRRQIARHLRFGSVTRVNAVLLRLSRHGYLTRRIQPTLNGARRQLYTLGPQGLELLEPLTSSIRPRRRWRDASDLFAEHQLLVNDVRLEFEHANQPGYRLLAWQTEHTLRSRNLGIVPDAYVEYELAAKTFACFVEADNGTETLGRLRAKSSAYVDLAFSGRFHISFARQFFRVLIVAPSPGRVLTIQRELARHTHRLFWLTTFDLLAAQGPFGSIWRRPQKEGLYSLTQ